jgi:hypothetical protein
MLNLRIQRQTRLDSDLSGWGGDFALLANGRRAAPGKKDNLPQHSFQLEPAMSGPEPRLTPVER